MAVIRVPNVFKIGLYELAKEPPPALSEGYLEYEVSEDMKKFWDSLSERERETLVNISEKEHKDLREVLSKQMQAP